MQNSDSSIGRPEMGGGGTIPLLELFPKFLLVLNVSTILFSVCVNRFEKV